MPYVCRPVCVCLSHFVTCYWGNLSQSFSLHLLNIVLLEAWREDECVSRLFNGELVVFALIKELTIMHSLLLRENYA